MFRLFRTLILVLVAFVAGILFERQAIAERCETAGGTLQDSICRGVS
ncbi:MAG: hypothetical protein ACFB11_00080 [Paracoccaceae bacterium]